MEDIRLIIFDLDGTLLDAYLAIGNSFNYLMRKFGLKPQPLRVIRRLVGWGDLNLLKPYLPAPKLKHALSLYREHHKHSLLKYSHLYPSVRSLLSGLKKQGYRLAVASNRPSKFSRILLKHLKIGNFFDYVLCADQLRYGKPHPMILNRIIKKFKLNKSQALYVGDMAIDAQAGRRAKIKTIIVTSGSSSKLAIEQERPFRIITRVKQLSGLL